MTFWSAKSLIFTTWRSRTLWIDSGPGSSCASPGWTPLQCDVSPPNGHFIRARWIFRLWMFMHFYGMHILPIVCCPVLRCVNDMSIRLGYSVSPPHPGHPLVYFSIWFIVAFSVKTFLSGYWLIYQPIRTWLPSLRAVTDTSECLLCTYAKDWCIWTQLQWCTWYHQVFQVFKHIQPPPGDPVGGVLMAIYV